MSDLHEHQATDAIAQALRQAFPQGEGGGAFVFSLAPHNSLVQSTWGDLPEFPRGVVSASQRSAWLNCARGEGIHVVPIRVGDQTRGAVVLNLAPLPEWGGSVLDALASSLQATLATADAYETALIGQARLTSDLASGLLHSWNNILQGVSMQTTRMTRKGYADLQPSLEALTRLWTTGRETGQGLLALALSSPQEVAALDEVLRRVCLSVVSLKGGRNLQVEVGALPPLSVLAWPVHMSLLMLLNSVVNPWGPGWHAQISAEARTSDQPLLRLSLTCKEESDSVGQTALREKAEAARNLLRLAGGDLTSSARPHGDLLYDLVLPNATP